MNFKNKILKILIVDGITALIGLLNVFILPKLLDIQQYSTLRTFTLYIGYTGIFQLGFIDGIYILLAGKKFDDELKEKISGYFKALLKIILIVAIIFTTANLFIKDEIFTLFILQIISSQIVQLISLIFRATGEVNKYTKLNMCINLINLSSIIAIPLLGHQANTYMYTLVIGYYIVAFYYLIKYIDIKDKTQDLNLNEIKYLINIGFFVMIANTINQLFYTIDRWFVKVFLTDNDFAFYSFTISILNLYVIIINAFSTVIFPILADRESKELNTKKLTTIILLLFSFAPGSYFLLEIIINTFLSHYNSALEILKVLVLVIPFMSVINIIYSNLYRLEKRGKRFLCITFFMLILASLLNSVCMYFLQNVTSIAILTVVSIVIWYFISSNDFDGMKINRREIIHIMFLILLYCTLHTIEGLQIFKLMIFIVILFIEEIILFKSYLAEFKTIFLN